MVIVIYLVNIKITKKKNLLVFFGQFIKEGVKIIFIKVRNFYIGMFIKTSNNDITFSRIYYFYKSRFKSI